MRQLMMYLSVLGVGLACFACVGCEFPPEQANPVVDSNPLPVDPTSPAALEGWWSNGRMHLHLQATRGYTLYGPIGSDRDVIERGRWTYPSYAYIMLEPYRVLHALPRRVTVTRIEGRLALAHSAHEHQPFYRSEPPRRIRLRPAGASTQPVVDN